MQVCLPQYDSICGLRLYLHSDIVLASVTRGNNFTLVPQHCKYDLTKYRLVPVLNSLHNNVLMVDNINLFKKSLDKFCSLYDVVYLITAYPLGTGRVQ